MRVLGVIGWCGALLGQMSFVGNPYRFEMSSTPFLRDAHLAAGHPAAGKNFKNQKFYIGCFPQKNPFQSFLIGKILICWFFLRDAHLAAGQFAAGKNFKNQKSYIGILISKNLRSCV